MQSDLIYDVGAHHGHDTAHYLSSGFRVIAIEAYPESISILQDRFSQEIKAERLILVPFAVGPNAGEVEFFVPKSESGSCSLIADEVDDLDAVIRVKCIPFSDVLRRYGVPHYLKSDIQGVDRHILESLGPEDLPDYISWELDRDQLECMKLVHEMGYRRFKIIDQYSFLEMDRQRKIRYRLARKVQRTLRRFGIPIEAGEPGSRFPAHSSGPFGEHTDGPWRSYDHVCRQWSNFARRYPTRKEQPGWYDCHAAK